MGSRWLLGLATAVLSATLLGCRSDASASGPEFTTAYPAATAGDLPLPMTLIDQTGLVAAIVPAPNAAGGSEPSSVGTVPGTPNALRVQWLGGVCDDRVTLVFNAIGATDQLAIHNHLQITAGALCPAAGILRTLDIGFNRHLDPEQLTISLMFP